MVISDFTLFLLFEADEIFGLDEFLELGSDFVIVSDFSSICFFFGTRIVKRQGRFLFSKLYIF